MGERQRDSVEGEREESPSYNIVPLFQVNKLPQKNSKTNGKDFINLSTTAKPKLSTFQVLLEVKSSFHDKTIKIHNNLYIHISMF